ncbi:RNA-directed DNA polymerase [Methylobacterium sp. WL9]|uniref:RNA-directed DNA polymerase n=1 Tax=Methylobacterium sp. WL9 TaxID=2603898 RepID=UPI0011C97F19|nr:RNA-directed DNA polymerase [Methylobacterium sp. WL9]TXN21916.1 RNA-directed DNA polymerase [Methylobacterium sp. WL9]
MSAKNKSERVKRLVSHGYFAPELPPCFVSEDLARYRKSIISGIDKLPLIQKKPNYYYFKSEPTWFYFPRFGKQDRRHGVPNPVAHLLLARALAENYIDLRRKARKSKFTLSPPVFDWAGSRALMRPSIELRDDFRINLSSRREEYVAADVRAFFHSIYTHAIPWAIHGKEFAKQNRGLEHYGNLIDLLCRNAQDGQTLGLPVGPDTSRLIAEVVASAMDARLQQKLQIGARDASRYIDDYTLSSPNGASGEELLAAVRQSAATFELELNSDKSSIYLTSHRQSTGWQQAARAYLPKQSPPGHKVEIGELQHFLYLLGRTCLAHADINVEKFGLQHARSALVNVDDWSALQFSLINAYRRNPSLISLLVEVCLLRQVAHSDVRVDIITEFIESRIPVLARANRTGEIIWLLFLAIRLELTLSSERLAVLFVIENAFVALLVVCLASRGFVKGVVDRGLWDRSLNVEGLRSPMWLHAYEAVTQGFIPEVDDGFIVGDAYFKFLRTRRVQFLDLRKGYASISTTLRRLREENMRLMRLREAIQDEDTEEFDDFFDFDEIEDEHDTPDEMNIY